MHRSCQNDASELRHPPGRKCCAELNNSPGANLVPNSIGSVVFEPGVLEEQIEDQRTLFL
jgi:hypothetical protein